MFKELKEGVMTMSHHREYQQREMIKEIQRETGVEKHIH